MLFAFDVGIEWPMSGWLITPPWRSRAMAFLMISGDRIIGYISGNELIKSDDLYARRAVMSSPVSEVGISLGSRCILCHT